jgi:hypothetical protein
MRTTKILPPSYSKSEELNLSSRPVIVFLNLLALGMAGVFYLSFVHLHNLLNSSNRTLQVLVQDVFKLSAWQAAILIIGIALMVVIHEWIHGVFFWIFTHEKPVFALKISYAFAAAPAWYLPRNAYLMVGLAPLIMISLLLLLLASMIPASGTTILLLIASLNAAGSLGDIVVVTWVLFHPKNSYVQDLGDRFILYSQDK